MQYRIIASFLSNNVIEARCNDNILVCNGTIFIIVLEDTEVDVKILKGTNQRIFFMYRMIGDLYQIIDPKRQFLSGISKKRIDTFEYPGCFVDDSKRIMNFRIAKNGSSVMSFLFLGGLFGRGTNTEKYIRLDNIVSDTGYYRFVIWRNTGNRIFSQIHHMLNDKNVWWYGKKFDTSIRKMIDRNFSVNFILRLYEILMKYHYTMNYTQWNLLDEEPHMIPQSLQLNKYLKRFKLDQIVMLDDLQDFIEERLNMQYEYKSTYGKNESVKEDILNTTNLQEKFNDMVERENQYIDAYKDIIWKKK